MISPDDIAQIEQWASASYPDRGDGARVAVRARGLQVNVTEELPQAAGLRTRSIVRLRYRRDTGTWQVQRLFGGGRWLEKRPASGPLRTVLDAIDLERFPR